MPLDAIRDALGQLRLRLLDLTARNRLLNFKHSVGKSLQFIDVAPDALYNRLFSTPDALININAVPEPERHRWILIDGHLRRPDVKETAQQLGIPTSFELTGPTGKDALRARSSG